MQVLQDAEVFPWGESAIATEEMTVNQPTCAHSHEFAVLAFVRSGVALQHTERGANRLRTGNLTVLGPGSWHAYEPQDELKVVNLYLSERLLDGELVWLRQLPLIGPLLQPRPPLADNAVLTLDLDFVTQQATSTALSRFAEPGASGMFTRLARLFDLFAVLSPTFEAHDPAHESSPIPRGPQHATSASHLSSRYRESVAHAVAVLHDRIEASWNLERLAQEIALSPSQLARVFRADTGSSPMAFLQRIRSERMAYLLRTTTLTVASAGRAVGWDDPSYASRRFRAHWSSSPNAYRGRFGQSR
jgi:AraC-like DNA-binding protein